MPVIIGRDNLCLTLNLRMQKSSEIRIRLNKEFIKFIEKFDKRNWGRIYVDLEELSFGFFQVKKIFLNTFNLGQTFKFRIKILIFLFFFHFLLLYLTWN